MACHRQSRARGRTDEDELWLRIRTVITQRAASEKRIKSTMECTGTRSHLAVYSGVFFMNRAKRHVGGQTIIPRQTERPNGLSNPLRPRTIFDGDRFVSNEGVDVSP